MGEKNSAAGFCLGFFFPPFFSHKTSRGTKRCELQDAASLLFFFFLFGGGGGSSWGKCCPMSKWQMTTSKAVSIRLSSGACGRCPLLDRPSSCLPFSPPLSKVVVVCSGDRHEKKITSFSPTLFPRVQLIHLLFVCFFFKFQNLPMLPC